MFAHGQAEQAGDGAARIVGRRDQPPPRPLLGGDGAQGGAAGGVSEAGQGAGDLIQVPDSAQIGQGRQQVQIGLQHPQGRAHIVRFGVQGVGLGQDTDQAGGRVGLQQAAQMGGATPHQAGEIGRGPRHRRQGRPGRVQSVGPALGCGGLEQGFVQAFGGGGVGDGTGGDEAMRQRN